MAEKTMPTSEEILNKLDFDNLARKGRARAFEYLALKHPAHLSLKKTRVPEEDSGGWKIHLSIDDEDEDWFVKTWDTVVPILINHDEEASQSSTSYTDVTSTSPPRPTSMPKSVDPRPKTRYHVGIPPLDVPTHDLDDNDEADVPETKPRLK